MHNGKELTERNLPRPVALHGTCPQSNSGRRDGAAKPTRVIQFSETTSPLRWGTFDDVGRSANSGDGDTETKEETATDELSLLGRTGDNSYTDDDSPTSGKHACTATKPIADLTSDEGTSHLTNGVDREDDASRAAETTRVELFLVVVHRVDCCH